MNELSLFSSGLTIFGDTIGGVKFSNDGTVTTLLGTSGDYIRIGDAAATSQGLNSEDDLMVTRLLEVDGGAYFDSTVDIYSTLTVRAHSKVHDDVCWALGAGDDMCLIYETIDANAKVLMLYLDMSADGNNVPVITVGDQSIYNVDLGLFDSVTQPTIAMIEKDAKYTSSSAMTAAGAGAVMTKTGIFTSSVVGDVVRVTGGTNATAGWYWITTVTDADNVTLDRNWCTGAVTDGVMLAYHDFTMLSADGICTRITDGAPSDASVEIDRDGWMILDVGQANGRLYWRANNAWHYVDATA